MNEDAWKAQQRAKDVQALRERIAREQREKQQRAADELYALIRGKQCNA